MREERVIRYQAGHRDDLPAGRGAQLARDHIELGNLARCRLEARDGVDPLSAGVARHELRLALEEPPVERVLRGAVAAPVLLHGVVEAGTRVIATQLRFHAAGFSTPRRTWSSSIDSNSA